MRGNICSFRNYHDVSVKLYTLDTVTKKKSPKLNGFTQPKCMYTLSMLVMIVHIQLAKASYMTTPNLLLGCQQPTEATGKKCQRCFSANYRDALPSPPLPSLLLFCPFHHLQKLMT